MKHISIVPHSCSYSPKSPKPLSVTPRGFASNTPRKPGRMFRFPRSVARSAYAGSVYPNGEFTVGYVGCKKKTADVKRYERGEVDGIHGTSPESDFVETPLGSTYVPHSERIYSPLTLSTPRNHHNASRKYGKNGITSFGRRMVRNAAERIQEVNGIDRTGFFTLTLPEYPPSIVSAICSNWADLTRRYFQELSREHKRHNFPFCYIAVTEIQSRRWLRTGNPGYHIHYVTPVYRLSPKRGDYLITYEWMRNTWGNILQTFVDTLPLDGVGFTSPPPRVGCERVKSSASAYLAKYMSKGSALIAEVVADMGEDCIPGQWWSISANLRSWIKSHTVPASPEFIDYMFSVIADGANADILYFSRYYVQCPARGDICVSVSGRMSASCMSACILAVEYPLP